MKPRLFILTNDPVPYGTANANYIRNFAKAVASCDWNVIVIGMRLDDDKPDFYKLVNSNEDNIQYYNINDSKLGAKNYLRAYFKGMDRYTSVLKHFNAGDNDYIFVYTTELATGKAAISYKNIKDTHKSYCEVEWFQPFQYKHGMFSILFILWRYGFYHRANKFNKAIPISVNLEEYIKKKNCKTLVVPAMIDSSEGNLHIVHKDTVDFIYPGSASDKDSFSCMINAFLLLSDEEKLKVRFHLTGNMSKEKLKKIIGESVPIEKLKEILKFHGWIEYDELMELYKQSDYLLLARKKNIVTISNFPSKVPEMMNFGIVPVCSKVGDYTEKYLSDGIDSIQFYEDNVDSCVLAIKKAIKIKEANKLERMKRNARETAINKFDYKVWGNTIVDFLQS